MLMNVAGSVGSTPKSMVAISLVKANAPTKPKATPIKASIIPCLRYRNAPAAIDWLCSTFGFERHLVVPHPDGTIAHAQLSFGNGMIMIGSVAANEFARLMKQPDEIGGCETQSPYLIVKEVDRLQSLPNRPRQPISNCIIRI